MSTVAIQSPPSYSCLPTDHAFSAPAIAVVKDGARYYKVATAICSKCGETKTWYVGEGRA